MIVGGMAFGTLLTLFVVPTAYTLLARAAAIPPPPAVRRARRPTTSCRSAQAAE